MAANLSASNPQVEALAAEAERLARSGQPAAAARLWDQVLALAPEHGAALNFQGQSALARGDLAEARRLLERAARGQPRLAISLANLARVLRATDDPKGALRALDEAGKLEPSAYAVHFEKASIYEQLGRERDAALAYEMALQMLPPQHAQAPQLQPLVARARVAVMANKDQLASFLEDRLSGLRGPAGSRGMRRFEESLDINLGRKPAYVARPLMFNFPGLPSIAFFDREDFDWAPAMEAQTAAVQAELRRVIDEDGGGFEPYVQTLPDEPAGQFAPLDRNPDWSAYFLWKHGQRIEEHARRCPATMAALDAVPQIHIHHRAPAALFSALKPHTHIPAHNGATNCRLTVHLPLIVPEHCRFRVGNHVRTWTPGELLIFDDTIEHEAWNDSDHLRVVMIFDVWHPMLTEAERVLVKATQEGMMAYYGTDAPLGEL